MEIWKQTKGTQSELKQSYKNLIVAAATFQESSKVPTMNSMMNPQKNNMSNEAREASFNTKTNNKERKGNGQKVQPKEKKRYLAETEGKKEAWKN